MHTVALCITLLYAAGLGQNAVLFEHPDSLGHNISTFRRNTPATSQQMPLQDLHTPLKPHHACDKHFGFKRQAPSETTPDNVSPTPAPTGDSSPSTTVHITDEHDFALLLPNRPGELISDAENDGVAFCTPASSSCPQRMQDGFIRAAAVAHADDGSWVQVTGCIDTSKSTLSPSDDGGQFDVRYPNGAQCTFGGYAASFIEQVEPSAGRFCLRCCATANDQMNCNSHQDRAGCVVAIPGTYDFPELGVSCS